MPTAGHLVETLPAIRPTLTVPYQLHVALSWRARYSRCTSRASKARYANTLGLGMVMEGVGAHIAPDLIVNSTKRVGLVSEQ
jgi:hypothetical protein